MKNLIFLDTEATGNEIGKDRLSQVCYEVNGEIRNSYFKPPVPMSVKAMSVTHITNKMLEDKEPFIGSKMREELQALLSGGVMVAHNAAFDIAMLKSEEVEVPKWICTLRVARHLDKENKIPEYNLQFLRYYLELEIEGSAHDAEGDVKVLKGVFERLFKKIREAHETDEEAIEEMIAISSRPTLFNVFNFGKHKDKPIAEVVKSDRGYLEWLLAQKEAKPEAEEDWLHTLKHYLGL